jgi:hypothetical protein
VKSFLGTIHPSYCRTTEDRLERHRDLLYATDASDGLRT